jgi:hypothetical protein
MSYPERHREFWDAILDRCRYRYRYRCAEVDGQGDRRQLVVGHDGRHVLQRAGRRLAWPIGAQPHDRPPWAGSFPRDET